MTDRHIHGCTGKHNKKQTTTGLHKTHNNTRINGFTQKYTSRVDEET